MQLKDREVQDAIELFVQHARICARTDYDDGRGILGVAAVATIFSCILTVGEALVRANCKERLDRAATQRSVRAFYQKMEDKSWLVPPTGITRNDDEACMHLTGIRHGLAHVISMPWRTMLVPNRESLQLHSPEHWRIVVPDFVEEVYGTLTRLTQEHGELSLDAVITKARYPVGRRRPAEDDFVRHMSSMLNTATSGGD